MPIDVVLDTARNIIEPILCPEILGVFGFIYLLARFGRWIDRKAALAKYEDALLLEKEKLDLKKKIMSGKGSKFDITDIKALLADENFKKLLGNELDIGKFLEDWK